MATGNYYIFTPCCGGHPVVLSQNFVIFDELPKVYKYVGVLPYVDSTGLYSLMPGQCYQVQQFSAPIGFVAGLNPTPPIENFEETTYDTCEDGALGDVKCDCPNVYQLTSCCTGETTLYNITGLTEGTIVEGETYTVILDPTDYTTIRCYIFNALSINNPELVPTLNANLILTTPVDCTDSLCQLVCNPCECYEFTGTSGLIQAYTCDLDFVIIRGTIDGVLITYPDQEPVLLTEGICLRLYTVLAPGLSISNSGLCDIVYWNQSGSEINCPTYYKIVNCRDANEEYCVSNNLSTEFASGLVLTVNGPTFANKCWRIEETSPCPQTITISFTITDISCEECLEKNAIYFQLTNCNDGEVFVYTSTNLQEFVGSIITLNEYPEDCWYVEALSTQIPSDIPVTVNQPFLNCDICTGPQYLLEDCDIDNPDPNIITNVDLSAYVGQVVTLLNCPDKCWIVSETDPIPTPQLVNVTDSYQSCELCIQPAPIPDPPVYKYKSIRPGYNTPGCESDKYERIVCNFSEAMYRQIMVDAYGITPCCGEDDIKYEIKHELIKLKAIQDPDYNCKLISSCECTTSISGLTPCTP